jgi:7-cyano-7-deazaguanine synthase
VARRAVVLLSGGADSATALAWAVSKGYECHALSVDYGQRHRFELRAARKVATALGAARHVVLKVDLSAFGGSALFGRGAVPKGRPPGRRARAVPPTYVPARNTALLSLAVAWAESLGARDIFLGVNAVDYSGYPDCRPEFLAAFARAANLGTKAGTGGRRFRIRAPLVRMTKARILRTGARLGVPFRWTHSCYDPDRLGRACGACDSCLIRREGFAAAGIEDPTRYSPGASEPAPGARRGGAALRRRAGRRGRA